MLSAAPAHQTVQPPGPACLIKGFPLTSRTTFNTQLTTIDTAIDYTGAKCNGISFSSAVFADLSFDWASMKAHKRGRQIAYLSR